MTSFFSLICAKRSPERCTEAMRSALGAWRRAKPTGAHRSWGATSLYAAQQGRATSFYPLRAVLLLLAVFAVVAPASAERIKDLAQVGGVRTNALVGYGLVVGLDGSGDRTSQAPFTVQSLKNLLGELGVNVPANVNPQLKNVAAVASCRRSPSRASRSTSPCRRSATRCRCAAARC